MDSAFITGAAGDIGRAVCARLLEDGYRIVATDVNEAGLNELRDACIDPARLLPVRADVRSLASVQQAAAAGLKAFGSIELLINNAGGISSPSLRTTTEEDWLRDIELNLTGAWRCMHALQENMLAQRRGVIVNIASVNGLGVFGHPGYSVAKAGLIHLTKFAAVEFGRFGVRSIAICPGSVRTQAWRERMATEPDILERVLNWYPTRRLCEPEDVAAAVALAASPQCSQLNGAVLTLDGGLTAGCDQIATSFTAE